MIPKLNWIKFSFILIIFLVFISLGFSYSVGPNYRNVSVDTKVNITNAGPEVQSITLENPITLVAGSTKRVQCNASVFDYNGYGDIYNVNATFFHSSSSFSAADNNNTHYTNSSCLRTAQNGYYANYTCSFDVYYYAINQTWNCSVSVNDTLSFDYRKDNSTIIYALYALNVTSLIDYGDMAIGDTSANKTANVTNIGNTNMNISVYGYGLTPGDGLAMDCAVGNISIANEKFSYNISHNYTQKTPLTSFAQPVGLTVNKQTTPGVSMTNTTYWQLYVPPNPFGVCNGTVVFQAEGYIE